MSITKECCTRPAVQSNYEPMGRVFDLDDLKIYETGDQSSKRVLISAYDIFGFHPNTKQVTDLLAKTGFLVTMPDFFRNKPYDATNFPPADRSVLIKWIHKMGNWSIVKPDLEKVIAHYKKQGVTGFGIFGFCWGGKVAVQAGAELSDDIKAVGLIHPSLLESSDFELINCPVIFLPSKNEPDLVPFQKQVQKRLGDDAAEHVRFDDMEHGFVAARSDFNDKLNKERVEEVIELLSKFFNKYIKN